MSCDENKISDQIDGGLNQQKEDRQILLDYLAGQAMQGILSSETEMRTNGGMYGKQTYSAQPLAQECYDIAEAMLAERERRMKGEK